MTKVSFIKKTGKQRFVLLTCCFCEKYFYSSASAILLPLVTKGFQSMIRPFSFIVGFGLLLLAGLHSSAMAYEAVVTHILDGDSFRVRRGDTTETIRLYGIDCPEYRQDGWQGAKKMTTALLGRYSLEIQPMDTDRYGRTVALVRARGRLVNAELVRNGWAWVYRRYCRAQPLCRQLDDFEQEARRDRRGIWRKKKPVPPWVWKRRSH